MVAQREELEKTRRKHLKRLRIIWFSILGVIVLVVVLFALYQTGLIFGLSQNAQSVPQNGDWSMFRRDLGHSGNAGTDNLTSQGTLAWTFATGGVVHSSPAVVDGVVYFGSRDHKIYALDAVTGEQKWVFETGSWVDSSPVVVGGVVYCGSNDGNLYALNAKTGEKIWSFQTVYALRSSPAIADGVVYIGNYGYIVYAVDAATGKERWHRRTGNIIMTSPVVEKGVVVISSTDRVCYSFDAKSGRPRLQYVTSYPINASAAVKDGVAYFTDTDGYFTALDVGAKNWLWENKIRTYWNVLHAYGIAPNPPKPSGYLWVVSLGFAMPQGSSPALAGNNAYFGANNEVISLDLVTHKIQWIFSTDNLVVSSPAIADTAIYFGGEDGHVYALDRATGTKLWDSAIGDATQSSPAIANGMLYIGCDDGKLYAFK